MSNGAPAVESPLPVLSEQSLNGEPAHSEVGWVGRVKTATVCIVASLALAACSSGGASSSAEHAPPPPGQVQPQPEHTPAQSGGVLFSDNFNTDSYPGSDKHPVVVTGEGAHFNPGADCPTDSKYIMTSGTLIVDKGVATTEDPTTETGDVPCDSAAIEHNDNDVFRLLTKESFGPNISASVDYTPIEDTNPQGQDDSFDGFTMWVGNQPNSKDEDYGLYTVSIRNGGEVVIKKKVPEAELTPDQISELKQTGDFANGGGYYVLGDYITLPDLAAMGKQRHIMVNLEELPDGHAQITLIVDGKQIVSAVDKDMPGKQYLSGQVGLRLDNTKATFDNFEVAQLPPVPPTGSPESPTPSRRVSALGQVSIADRPIPPLSPQTGSPSSLQSAT